MTLLVHIAAGGVALVAGYAALFAPKGARLHRRSGMLFVFAMVAMGCSAALLSVARDAEATALGGMVAAYLVITATTTVRPRTAASRRLDGALMLLALGLGVRHLQVGLAALAAPDGAANGVPGAVSVMVGVIMLLAGASDLRVLRADGVHGGRRLARHLWRMCYALWMAAGSFFLGQADELPEPLRIFPLLAVPVLAVFVMMAYWLWRVRFRAPPLSSPPRAPRRAPAPRPAPLPAEVG